MQFFDHKVETSENQVALEIDRYKVQRMEQVFYAEAAKCHLDVKDTIYFLGHQLAKIALTLPETEKGLDFVFQAAWSVAEYFVSKKGGQS